MKGAGAARAGARGGRSIGLDIGTSAVRAVEVHARKGAPVVVRLGQVALPTGAVADGEIRDPEAVSAALRRLWSRAGFSSKSVVVGLGSPRIVVRETALPAMDAADMAAALAFDIGELVPIAPEDAIFDFQVTGTVAGPTPGDARSQVLVAAAPKDLVGSHLAVLASAGLSASLVDLVPLAVVRAAARPVAGVLGEGEDPEAIVSVGAGVTTVVVHENGVPRFARVLPIGGEDVTGEITSELSLPWGQAEELKRRATHGAGASEVAAATRVITSRVGPLVDEVRGSLDYYLSQGRAAGLSRVVLAGGGSVLVGLAGSLADQLGVEVVRLEGFSRQGTTSSAPGGSGAGIALAGAGMTSGMSGARTIVTPLDRAKIGLADEDLDRAGQVMAVAAGLALAGLRPVDGARRISLVPASVSAEREQRRDLAVAVAALTVLSAGLLGAWALQGGTLASTQQKASAGTAQAQLLQSQVASLGSVNVVDAAVSAQQQTVSTVLSGDVSWPRVLADVGSRMPSDVWVTSITATGASANGAAAPAPTAGSAPGTTGAVAPAGTLSFSVKGTKQASPAQWLVKLASIRSLSGPWVATINQSTPSTVTFSSTVDLTAYARSHRATLYLKGAR